MNHVSLTEPSQEEKYLGLKLPVVQHASVFLFVAFFSTSNPSKIIHKGINHSLGIWEQQKISTGKRLKGLSGSYIQ